MTTTRTHILLPALALVLPLALSACGGGSESGSGGNPAAGGQSTAPGNNAGAPGAPASDAPLPDPCSLATTEEVSAAFSTKANGPNPGEDAVGDPECNWTWLDPALGPCSVSIAPRQLRKFDFKSADAEDIDGVGDAAYREPKFDIPANVLFRKGDSHVLVKRRCNGDTVNGREYDPATQGPVNAFAKAIADKL